MKFHVFLDGADRFECVATQITLKYRPFMLWHMANHMNFEISRIGKGFAAFGTLMLRWIHWMIMKMILEFF